MTKRNVAETKSSGFLCYYILVFVLITVLIIFSDSISESIRQSISLAAFSVIPSIFPFIVLSDFLSSKKVKMPFGEKISNLFSIPEGCEGAFFCGLICGFPCGVKYAVSLYDNGYITKPQLETIIGLVNNPSLAFVISGVGVGMLNSIKDGLLLYFSIIISLLFVAKIFGIKSKKSYFSENTSRQTFNFTKSIKNAGIASITIASYIIFFSAILGIFKSIIKSNCVLAFIASILEIGNATAQITLSSFNSPFSFLLLGFALGFSGLSVHLQAFDLLPTDVSRAKYFKMKITQGLFCSITSFLLKLLTMI